MLRIVAREMPMAVATPVSDPDIKVTSALGRDGPAHGRLIVVRAGLRSDGGIDGEGVPAVRGSHAIQPAAPVAADSAGDLQGGEALLGAGVADAERGGHRGGGRARVGGNRGNQGVVEGADRSWHGGSFRAGAGLSSKALPRTGRPLKAEAPRRPDGTRAVDLRAVRDGFCRKRGCRPMFFR